MTCDFVHLGVFQGTLPLPGDIVCRADYLHLCVLLSMSTYMAVMAVPPVRSGGLQSGTPNAGWLPRLCRPCENCVARAFSKVADCAGHARIAC